ncbi:AAA family ATPase [Gymnodinialimonas hymeniacidonis]|uniref:AAA family ATPase n=1 Tax=Gymnodinialimonas hymeniacidonis TaxID=3126508 RepID=UPI0034C6AFCE
MKRVMIIGQPGSGKSTLARLLGEKTGLPVYHMDQIHWMSGWVERARTEKIALAMEVQNSDTWIFEGGLGATKEHRLLRCDTLINLDFRLWLRAWRVGKRTFLHYGRTRPDLPDGCPEQVSFEFWKWIWDTREKNRLANLRWMEEAGPHVTVHHLCSPAQVSRFLDGVV